MVRDQGVGGSNPLSATISSHLCLRSLTSRNESQEALLRHMTWHIISMSAARVLQPWP